MASFATFSYGERLILKESLEDFINLLKRLNRPDSYGPLHYRSAEGLVAQSLLKSLANQIFQDEAEYKAAEALDTVYPGTLDNFIHKDCPIDPDNEIFNELFKENESQSSQHCDSGYMNDVRFGDC